MQNEQTTTEVTTERRINLDAPAPFAETPFAASAATVASWVSTIRSIELSEQENTAITLAADNHAKRYGGERNHSYMVHLAHVNRIVGVLCDSLGITQPKHTIARRNLLAAAWCHDIGEDCGVTFNDLAVKNSLGNIVAEYVFCVTGHGRNRKERFESVVPLITTNHGALLLKSADRIGNFYFSAQGARNGDTESRRMFAMYREEMPSFRAVFTKALSCCHDGETQLGFDNPLWSGVSLTRLKNEFDSAINAIEEWRV